MPRRLSRPLRRSVAVAAAAACLAAGGVWIASGNAAAGVLSGSLYRDPNSAVVNWVATNSGDSRMPQIRDKIASQPAAHWIANFSPNTVQADTTAFINAANNANQVPVLSVYEITNRDCGGASAGGAPNLTAYQQWITSFSRGLGNRLVVVILETDSIALTTCLSGSDLTARFQALSTAVQTIKGANANAKVYLDGGHSAWNPASEQANRLRSAGIQNADGFYTNVSNFQPTSNEINYGNAIISALNGAGVTGKRQIIDTSRNGGSVGASGDWCADDNTDRRLGQYPTLNTGNGNIDGFLWIKPPGEADGCAFTAGSFQPNLAFSLSTGVPNPPNTTTPPNTTPPNTTAPPTTTRPPTTTTTTTRPPTTTTTTPPTTGACSATYKLINSWQGGYQAEVTVKAGSTAINGWTTTFPFNGQITQLWNGALTTSGQTATVKNVDFNRALGPNATAVFGFLTNGTAITPSVTCTSP